jgi:hypothetical protein
MKRVFTGQCDDHLFVRVFRLQGELILANCTVLLKKGGWKGAEHSEYKVYGPRTAFFKHFTLQLVKYLVCCRRGPMSV